MTNRIVHRAFSLPKEGKSEEEYEDAWAVDDAAGIYTLADGASDSVFSRLWAQLLVRRFMDAHLPIEDNVAAWQDWAKPAQKEWEATIRANPVPWYVESKMREGAFATCLALVLPPSARGSGANYWGAIAVGDTCLFHIAASGAPEASFPLTRADQFNNYPLAVCSKPLGNERVWSQVARKIGTWQPGDSFILATDAMAEWIIREIGPAQAWDHLLSLADAGDDAFRQLVAEERSHGRMHNDDLTLLIVRMPAGAGEGEGDDADVALAG